jgi:hypothetical protein
MYKFKKSSEMCNSISGLDISLMTMFSNYCAQNQFTMLNFGMCTAIKDTAYK